MNDSPYFCIFSHVVLCSTPCNININWQKNKVGKKKFIDAQWVYWFWNGEAVCTISVRGVWVRLSQYTTNSKPIAKPMAQEISAASTFKAYKKHHDDGEDHFFWLD